MTSFARLVGILALMAAMAQFASAQVVADGFTILTTDWDRESPGTGYNVVKWTYSAGTNTWEPEPQPLLTPYSQSGGAIYDMAMDMITLDGSDQLSGIFLASSGATHFPSTGTEFQHRKLNDMGQWETFQDPLMTTPANVSPLGFDIYKVGNQYRMAWVEDHDTTAMGYIYDQGLALDPVMGTLSVVGTPTLLHSQPINFGSAGVHGETDGGLTGVMAVDWDDDGDADYVYGEFFRRSPGGVDPRVGSQVLIEQTSPGVFAEPVEVFWWNLRRAQERLQPADIDGDDDLDWLSVDASTVSNDITRIYWFEKEGNTVVNHGILLDTTAEGAPYGLVTGHIFGIFANELPPIPGTLLGDANSDGVVDIFDVNVISDQWGTSGPQGDVNHDGTVDIFDVNVVSDNWTSSGSSASAVPEPTSWILAVLGCSGAVFVARRRAAQ